MEISKLENVIEAVLFISGDGVELGRIADMFEMDMGTAEKIADNYMDKYNYDGHGLKIIKYNDVYQLTTNPEYADYIASDKIDTINASVKWLDNDKKDFLIEKFEDNLCDFKVV